MMFLQAYPKNLSMKTPLTKALILTLVICGFTAFKTTLFKKTGIEGYVYKVAGNQMPSPDIKPAAPQGMKAVISIYELTNINQARQKSGSPFFSSISTKLVKQVETNKKGYFKVKLPPGDYSLFIQKDSLFYANQFDSKNNILPVTVRHKKMSKVELRMDYNAVY
jgi:hypothetical protein